MTSFLKFFIILSLPQVSIKYWLLENFENSSQTNWIFFKAPNISQWNIYKFVYPDGLNIKTDFIKCCIEPYFEQSFIWNFYLNKKTVNRKNMKES